MDGNDAREVAGKCSGLGVVVPTQDARRDGPQLDRGRPQGIFHRDRGGGFGGDNHGAHRDLRPTPVAEPSEQFMTS
jgi:hypothetical protein